MRVGKVKDLFVVYKHNGLSRGVAVVHFFEPEAALKARNMWVFSVLTLVQDSGANAQDLRRFHGKVVDAELAMRIEIVGEPQSAPPPLSLLSRISGVANTNLHTNRPPANGFVPSQQQRSFV